MFVQKNFSFTGFMSFSGHHIVWLTLWSGTVTALYVYTDWNWVGIPWLPLSLVGIAVAFYVGFKNNQSYDRIWEARKIWGAIVNSSRSWATAVKGFTSNIFTDDNLSTDDLHTIRKRLIYRHLAWLYMLREQLLIPTQWEHVSLGGAFGRFARQRRRSWGVDALDPGITENAMKEFLPPEERENLESMINTATQIIDAQSTDLLQLREKNVIDDFRHMKLQGHLDDFYTHQGKCERIKKFPFPRQYGAMSKVFVGLFIFLLPFGLMTEFSSLGDHAAWLNIPFSVIVGWVFILMELVGDYSENPFEGLGNDIPMLSLCRTIEIDLREMLGEKDLPPQIEPKNNVLL